MKWETFTSCCQASLNDLDVIQYMLQVTTKLCYDYSGIIVDTNSIRFIGIYTVTIHDTRFIQVHNCGYVLALCSKLALS